MSDQGDLERALEDARRAREEAERLREDARNQANKAREEARRLRDEARQLEHRLRDQAREEARRGRGRPSGSEGRHVRLDLDSARGPDEESTGGARAEQTFSLDGVEHVVVDQTAGNLTVRLCTEGETPGVVTIGQKSAPELEIQRQGDRLVIEVHMQKGWLFRRKQGVTTVVRLATGPRSVRVNLGYGEMHVRDIACDEIKVEVGAGTITSYATSGRLDAEVGAGKLSLNAHRGLAKCNAGTGDVLLDLAAIAPGDYTVDVGMGRAEVRLPAGEQVYVKTSSGIGKSRNEYPSAPETAPTRMKLNTGIGEVVVKARSADAPDVGPAVTAKPQRSARGGPVTRRHEAEELRVLQMLEQGRITSQDAADLIAALQGAAPPVTGEE